MARPLVPSPPIGRHRIGRQAPRTNAASPTTHTQAITAATGRFDSLVHRGLNTLLEEDRAIRLIATGLDIPSLEWCIVQDRPRVAIVDGAITLPSLKRLRLLSPHTGVLVLEDRPSRANMAATLAIGVTRIARTATDADLLDAVRLVARGTPVLTSHDGRRVERRRPLNKTRELTQRQHEVLRHLSRAMSHAEIALALQISVRTVEKHVASIRQKLDVADRLELIGMPVLPVENQRCNDSH